MKDKINKDMDEYLILGACNPSFAFQILQLNKELGKHLPCSIAVYRENSKTVISAVNPIEIISSITDPKIIELAKIVAQKIERAVYSLD